MAIGTITIAFQTENLIGLSFAGDGEYPTGGTAAFEASVETAIATANAAAADAKVRGARNIEILDIIGGDCGQYEPLWDKTNGKLKVRDGGHATKDEVANEADLSGTTFNLTALYR